MNELEGLEEVDVDDIDVEEIGILEELNKNQIRTDYSRSLNHSYLWFYGLDYCDEYMIKLLNKNPIKEILPTLICMENNEYKYRYEISSLISLNDWIKNNTIGLKDVQMIFNALSSCARSMEEYLLEVNHLVLNPEYIFINNKEKSCKFVVFDQYEKDFSTSLKELVRYFIDHIDYSRKKEVECVYKIYELIQSPNYQLQEVIKELYISINEETPSEDLELNIEESTDIFVENKKPKSVNFIKIAFGFTAFLLVIFSIQVLTGQISKKYFPVLGLGIIGLGIILLIFIQKNKKEIIQVSSDIEDKNQQIGVALLKGIETEDIIINKEEFIIGTIHTITNAQIKNSDISRIHAKIYKRANEWCIMDLVSTNGTYQNGNKLVHEREYPLKDGDHIHFANVEYIFYNRVVEI
ncbi:FHA domain containing protein [Lachnospiraceae bacterium TWA4]|nr:FHA domain containing protein [Lachnospiraceae bacterium TWA4]